MAKVEELQPGDLVHLPGISEGGIALLVHHPHPIFGDFSLVIWWVNGDWSFDALVPHQEIGEITPSNDLERQARLKSILLHDARTPLENQKGKQSGSNLIAAERQRQVEQEGWTSEHDDEHRNGALADAAACYVSAARQQLHGTADPTYPRAVWPWDVRWWKPSDNPIRNLVKAGALIAAEIDRAIRKDKG